VNEELYKNWMDSKLELSKYKKLELKLRNEIIDSKITDEIEGSIKFKEGTYDITIGLGINNSLDESVLDTIWDNLSEKEKECIKYKPGLVAKFFKDLHGTENLFEAITQKPRQGTLAIKVSDE